MKKINLYIIDDDINLTEDLSKFIANNKDINILGIANDSIYGLSYIQNNHSNIDVLVMDLIMPKLDGLAVLNKINELKYTFKVIVITSYNSNNIIKEVSMLKADYLLLKPFSFEYLEEKIMKLGNEVDLVAGVSMDYIKNNVSKILHELGIPFHMKGYVYILDSILILLLDSSISRIRDIYETLALKNLTTAANVERTIRHSIEISFNRGNIKLIEEVFSHSIDVDKSKPTNLEYIVTLTSYVKAKYFSTYN